MTELEQLDIYECRLHWIIFLKPLSIILIPILMAYIGIHQKYVPIIFLVIALGWFISEMIRYIFTYLTIKPKNVIFQTGFLIQQTIDLPMRKIESIDIRQTLIGTIFNYGDIVITGSGGTQQIIQSIESPLTCRRYIEQYMHADEE